MSNRNVTHGAFTVIRLYPASPQRVFNAWADGAQKGRWFVGPPGWEQTVREQDFRIGGHERVSGGPIGQPPRYSHFHAIYHDIVPDERIVYSYDMHIDDMHISVSLATVEFKPEGGGTKLMVTEQGAFLDGYDGSGNREQGANGLLDQLAKALAD